MMFEAGRRSPTSSETSAWDDGDDNDDEVAERRKLREWYGDHLFVSGLFCVCSSTSGPARHGSNIEYCIPLVMRQHYGTSSRRAWQAIVDAIEGFCYIPALLTTWNEDRPEILARTYGPVISRSDLYWLGIFRHICARVIMRSRLHVLLTSMKDSSSIHHGWIFETMLVAGRIIIIKPST